MKNQLTIVSPDGDEITVTEHAYVSVYRDKGFTLAEGEELTVAEPEPEPAPSTDGDDAPPDPGTTQVPENPLLAPSGPPRYDLIRPEHVESASTRSRRSW